MAYINLESGLPGIVALFKYRPDTAYALNSLKFVNVLVRGATSCAGARCAPY